RPPCITAAFLFCPYRRRRASTPGCSRPHRVLQCGDSPQPPATTVRRRTSQRPERGAMTSSSPLPSPVPHPRLASFIAHFEDLLDTHSGESELLRQGSVLLADLVARDDWLPDVFAQPHPEHYQQFKLHVDRRS